MKNKMVNSRDAWEEMVKDEPPRSLSEKIIAITNGYMTFKEGDVEKSVKRLIEELDNYEKIEGFDQVISREKFKKFIIEEFGNKLVEFKGITITGVEKVDDKYIEKAINPEKEFKSLSENMLKDGLVDGYDVKESVERLMKNINNKIDTENNVKIWTIFAEIKKEFGDKFT